MNNHNSIYIHVAPKCNAKWWLLATKEYDNKKTNNNCNINFKKRKRRKRKNKLSVKCIQLDISNQNILNVIFIDS